MWKRLPFFLPRFLVSFISKSHLYFIYWTIHQNSIKTIVVVHCSLFTYVHWIVLKTISVVLPSELWTMSIMDWINGERCVRCMCWRAISLLIMQFGIIFEWILLSHVSCWSYRIPYEQRFVAEKLVEFSSRLTLNTRKSLVNGMKLVASFNLQFLHDSHLICTTMRRWQS